MDERTRKALEGSIQKWELIVSGTGEDHGAKNCPLCIEFYDTESDEYDDEMDRPVVRECYLCPVFQEVQRTGCEGTPYEWWGEAQSGNSVGWKAKTAAQIKAAKAELAFLKSLLPDKEGD